MSTSRTFHSLSILAGTLAVAGCAAATPPPELVSARTAYARAEKGSAARFSPAEVHTARVQLERAEAYFSEDGDTQDTRDEAYLALRKAELAEVMGRTAETRRGEAGIKDAMQDDQRRTVARTSAELNRTKGELAAQGAALDAQGAALRTEQVRREEAEQRARQAAADLARFATVIQEPRGMVISLSGGVLFASAKSDLLPAAQLKLNDVATALTKEDPLSRMVVEGHTDSQGSAANNESLSQRRAQSVRDYLVSRGIAADRITATGLASTRPIADNSSPEGRANNRRVEIVVQPATPR